MQFTFIDMAGQTLFVRDDAERAQWTQEEMTLDLEFPRIEGKVISIGQRVFFKDPSTGSHQIYEVKQAKTVEPDHLQIIVAENICISELSDEHTDNSQITGQTASNALQGVLSGTLWNVGEVSVNPVSSGDISRGSVWQAVLEITDNWNVYIEPRVTISANGSVSRYLDIKPTTGTENGVRLSIDKNMLDPSVTFDDSEVVTAMFGYGGIITSSDPATKDRECDFSSVVWSRTSSHPAKPAGQKYIEDPNATAEYGRNGRPRYGFYQNTDILDPNVLLQKTWESLQAASKPAISIEGTIADLYRMGYADQPIKLHDIALVEVNPAGFKSQIQIIRMTTDLLDPSATTVTIGSYIPNIVYIERKTNADATGSRGGGGSNSNTDNSWHEFRTSISQINDGTALRFQSVQNDINHQEEEIAVQTGRIDVAYDKITEEVIDRRDADNVLSGRITVEANRITQEVTRATGAESGLSGRITTEADRISLVVEGSGANAYIKAAQIVSSINDSGSGVLISANHIRLDGNTTVAGMLGVENGGLKVKGSAFINGGLTLAVGQTVTATNFSVSSAGHISFGGSTPGSSYTLTGSDVSKMLVSASVDGNVLTITDHSGNEVTFSKATSLSGEWSSNTYTVTAKQNGESVATNSVSPYVNPISSQGGSYVDLYVATSSSSSPYYDNHGSAKKLYLVQNGLTVYLKSEDSTSSGTVYAQTTIPGATVTGSWSGGTWTATSDHGGTASVSPFVQSVSSQGGAYVDIYVATSKSESPYYETHGNKETLYLVQNGLTVYLKSENSTSSGTVYGQTTIPNATVSGSWSSNTWTATSTHGGSASVSPIVQAVGSQGGAYVDLYVATSTSSSPYYETHGSAKKLYLVLSGSTVYLKSENSKTSGTVYAQLSASGTNLGIYDTNSALVTSQSITGSIDLWAGYKIDGTWQWGSKVTISNAYSSSNYMTQLSTGGSMYKGEVYDKNGIKLHSGDTYWYFSDSSTGTRTYRY